MATELSNVLIISGSLGSPEAALPLARAGHKVTIIERHPALRAGGTQINLRSQGIEVGHFTGILYAAGKKLMPEAGISVVDCNNKSKVYWPGGEGSGVDFFMQEVEIMRGDVVQVLYDATKESVTYMAWPKVESYEQGENSVNVTFSDHFRPSLMSWSEQMAWSPELGA